MASGRGASYETSEPGGADEPGSQASSLSRLSTSVRKCARSFGPFPVFSREWFAMSTALEQVSWAARAEESGPAASSALSAPLVGAASVSSASAGAGASERTLWERDALVARIMLEEGKVNLTLRNMHEWKVVQRSLITSADFRSALYAKLKLTEAQAASAALQFETSAGAVLACCMRAVETLQTTDMPLLIAHIAGVLQHALSSDGFVSGLGASLNVMQESLVAQYVLLIFRHIESLAAEARVLELIQEHALLLHMVRFANQFHGLLSSEVLHNYCLGVAAIVDSDAFRSRPDAFVPPGEDETALLKLHSSLVRGIMTSHAKLVKPLRALADYCEQLSLLLSPGSDDS